MNVYEVLELSENWNQKLFCDFFTTIRMHNPKKYFVGAKKTIFCKKTLFSNAEVVEVQTVTFSQIKPWLKIQDTGLMPDKFDGMFRTMYKYKVTDWRTQQWDIVLLKTEFLFDESSLVKGLLTKDEMIQLADVLNRLEIASDQERATVEKFRNALTTILSKSPKKQK